MILLVFLVLNPIYDLNFNNYLVAYMMKLVDMRGLKPRPFRGPGSTPGIGNKHFL